MSVTAAALALLLQPDASQLMAFTVGMVALLVTAVLPRSTRLGMCGMLLGVTAMAWRKPDPLAPVPYVEGIFTVAADLSPMALVAAVLAAALLVVVLLRAAWVSRSPGLCAVALYVGALFALAPLQVTPVPLLGFGAGPILGYFLAAGAVSHGTRTSRKAPEP